MKKLPQLPGLIGYAAYHVGDGAERGGMKKRPKYSSDSLVMHYTEFSTPIVQTPRMDIYASPRECQRRTKVYDICEFPDHGPSICKGDIFPTDCPLRKLPKEEKHG